MALWVFLLLALFQLSHSQSISSPADISDMESAMDDLRSRSYEGFIILLRMINYTNNSWSDGGATFLVPTDKVLSEYSISPLNIEQFVLSHLIKKALPFKNLMSFPTGAQIPSGLPNQMFTIINGGRRNFNVNNAKIIAPNICKSSSIKCHGIDAAISFDQQSIPPPPPALTPPPASTPPPALTPPPSILPLPNLGKNIPSAIHRQEPQSSSNELEGASAGTGAMPDTLVDQNSSSGVRCIAADGYGHLVILISGLSVLLVTMNI